MRLSICIISLAMLSVLFSCKDKEEDAGTCQLETPKANISVLGDSIVIVLNKVARADRYTVYYINAINKDEIATGSSTIKLNDTTFYVVTDAIYPGTTYKVKIFAVQTSPYLSNCFKVTADSPSFTTECGPFRFLRFRDIFATTTVVTWYLGAKYDSPADNNLTSFKPFTLNLRKKGTSNVTLYSTDIHYYKLTGLTPNTAYEVQLVYTCSDNETYTSKWFEFTTSN